MRTEEEFVDVLQNLEVVVIHAYQQNPSLTDYAVLRAYEGLIKIYRAELTQHEVKPISLEAHEHELLLTVQEMCEWRLGRLIKRDDAGNEVPALRTVTLEELLRCLKRLVKSVNTWNKANGRQGYLNFINEFLLPKG